MKRAVCSVLIIVYLRRRLPVWDAKNLGESPGSIVVDVDSLFLCQK